MKDKNQDIQDIDFVTANDSDLSGLPDSDDSDLEPEAIINGQEQENSDDEINENSNEECNDDKPLSELNGNPAAHIYCWRHHDASYRAYEFTGEYSLPPDTRLTPLQYFTKLRTNETLKDIHKNTNLYSVEKHGKSANTDSEEMIVQMPRYETYWSRGRRYLLLANAMPLNRYEQLRHILHVVGNDALHDKETEKLAKIRPMIEAIRNQCKKKSLKNTTLWTNNSFPAK